MRIPETGIQNMGCVAMKLLRVMGFQRGIAPFGGVQRRSLWQVRAAPGGVQRQSLWAGLGGSPTGEAIGNGTAHVV